MEYRVLGKTGLQVSVVGIGTWQLAGVWNKRFTQSEVNEIFACAAELGINFVDTAECYGDHLAESFIGHCTVAERERWVIATKFGHTVESGRGVENFEPEQVQRQLEGSLRALQTDYVDIYQMHSAVNEQFDNDALWTMLDKQVQAGKIRFLGNSLLMPQMRKQIEKSDDYGISVLQTTYNAVKTAAADTALPLARDMNLGVIVREPLASGFLSGKYQRGHRFEGLDVRAMRPADAVDTLIDDSLEALSEKPAGVEAVAWANAWCLRHPAVSTVIPGVKSVEQLRQNAGACELV